MKEIKQLIQIALDNKENSYSPYSHFRVSGVNIENAAYSPTLCAERSAMSAAISNGERDFSYIVITGDSKDTFPCGVCRQFIREFADSDTKIVIANSIEDYKEYTIEELLPHSFSNEDLKEI